MKVPNAPRARPRRSAGKAAVRMAGAVAKSIAAPTACTARSATSAGTDDASPHSAEPSTKSAKPPT